MAPRPERGAAALASSNPAYPIEYMGQACVELLLGFAEALWDNAAAHGAQPRLPRDVTALGGLGHALPCVIADFWTAVGIAIAAVDGSTDVEG